MDRLENSIIRTLAFNAAWGYAPTRLQLVMDLDQGKSGVPKEGIPEISAKTIGSTLDGLISQGSVVEDQGHGALAAYAEQIGQGRSKEFFFPRKLRKARHVAAYLRRLPWVRAVCLCNTTALGQARDQGDLDFFVIAKAGAIWRTRFFAALPFKLLGARPSPVIARSPTTRLSTDPVCLSFFITDESLDLSRFMLPEDDPYFRYWFLSLLPLYDDGVLGELWRQNAGLISRHPLARAWMVLDGDDLIQATKKGPPVSSWIESRLRAMQQARFPEGIRRLANQDTRVVIDDKALKFHVDDQRIAYRERYYDICRECGVEP